MASFHSASAAAGGSEGVRQRNTVERVDRTIVDMHATAHQARNYAAETLARLATQEEQIHRTEEGLREIQYANARSERVLKGMTWWGSLVNLFTPHPEAPGSMPRAQAPATSPATLQAAALEGSAVGAPASSRERAELLGGAAAPASRRPPGTLEAEIERQDEEIRQLEPVLDSLTQMAQAAGESLAFHNDALDRVNETAETVTDQTMFVGLRAAALVQRSRHTRSRLVGIYTFFHADTGRFLAAEGDDLYLRDAVVDRRCLWEVHEKEQGIKGLQNYATRKWVCLTWLGAIKCSSMSFAGAAEHLNILIERRTTLLTPLSSLGGPRGHITLPPPRPDTEGLPIRLEGVCREQSGGIVLIPEHVSDEALVALNSSLPRLRSEGEGASAVRG